MPSGGHRRAHQPIRARSLTIRRLLVRASSRSIANATSSGDGPVDQRLPTRWTSPRRSRVRSRASALALFRPAARATIAVENERGISASAAPRRSPAGCASRLSACGLGGGSEPVSGGADSGAGLLRPIGGSSPKRARQLPHKTTGSRCGGRTTTNRRHPRPERQTPQRRPARSISIRSSPLICSTRTSYEGNSGTDNGAAMTTTAGRYVLSNLGQSEGRRLPRPRLAESGGHRHTIAVESLLTAHARAIAHLACGKWHDRVAGASLQMSVRLSGSGPVRSSIARSRG